MSEHDEWLIMKLCMYVGDHDANNVSTFGCYPMTQLNFKKRHTKTRDAATGFAAVATRSRAGCWSMGGRRRESLINWPYQPEHSASFVFWKSHNYAWHLMLNDVRLRVTTYPGTGQVKL